MTGFKLKFFPALLVSMGWLTLAGCAFMTPQERTESHVSDTAITTQVKAAISAEPTLKSAEIKVETWKGVVQLSGFVITQVEEDRAIELAQSVKGVKSVKNDLSLK